MAACRVGVYWTANWMELGLTQGFRRSREGYSAQLTHADRDRLQLTGAPKIMLNAEQMRQFQDDSRSAPRAGAAPSSVGGVWHRGGRFALYNAFSDWADSLGQQAR